MNIPTHRVHGLFLIVLSLSAIALGDAAAATTGRTVIPLWPEGAPGSEGKSGDEKVRVTEQGDHVVTSVHRPSLTVYLPPAGTATGAAVLVIPGGGHRELWMDHEGYNIAEWLSARGIAGFVLKYRLAREEGSTYTIEQHSLADAQRALRTIRARSREWNVDPARVGVMGFSAGGQLAALCAMKGEAPNADAGDALARSSTIPAFQALIYPGRSDEIIPAKGAPPAFLVCGENDRPDISQGITKVYLRFREAEVSTELHIYAGAGHGFGLRKTNTGAIAGWLDRFHDWLDGQKLLRGP